MNNKEIIEVLVEAKVAITLLGLTYEDRNSEFFKEVTKVIDKINVLREKLERDNQK